MDKNQKSFLPKFFHLLYPIFGFYLDPYLKDLELKLFFYICYEYYDYKKNLSIITLPTRLPLFPTTPTLSSLAVFVALLLKINFSLV